MNEMVKMEQDKRASDSLEALNDKVIPVLCRQLGNKGLMPIEIKGLTRDILNIFGQGGLYNAGILNRKLERLGWQEDILDNATFELILYYLECEGTYTVESYVEQNREYYEGHH
ncbi:MAG: hypothetical protein WB792_14195 [Desulfobacterales bacterium]